MQNDKNSVLDREKDIRNKVNVLEGLHKSCQLSAVGLAEPVLNESRYLARALADLLHFEKGTVDYSKALGEAEHAARNATNDAIDLLITYVKTVVKRIELNCPKFDIATSVFGDDFITAFEVLETIDPLIVYSRSDRTKRYPIYEELASSGKMQSISNFALRLRHIEAVAKRTQAGVTKLPIEAHAGDSWLAQKISDALTGVSAQANLEVHFQPKYQQIGELKKCVGAEALMRLTVDGQNINPSLFITVAEHNGLINGIGKFALNESIKLLKRLPELPSVSVNVSPYELLDDQYSKKTLEIVQSELGDEIGRLELEITEGSAIADLGSSEQIKQLSEAGIQIAIDDFGTGQTKFDYLAELKVNVLKIDISLVRKLRASPKNYTPLLKAIVEIGKVFDLTVVAEGVEYPADIEKLEGSIGVSVFQGWLFGKVVSADQFLDIHKSQCAA